MILVKFRRYWIQYFIVNHSLTWVLFIVGFLSYFFILSEQNEGQEEAGHPREEVVVEGGVDELNRAEQQVVELVHASALAEGDADVLRAQVHFFSEQHIFWLELILFDLGNGVKASGCLPAEHRFRVLHHLCDLILGTHNVEIVIELGHDKNDNKVCNNIKVVVTVTHEDKDVGDFDDDADGEL